MSTSGLAALPLLAALCAGVAAALLAGPPRVLRGDAVAGWQGSSVGAGAGAGAGDSGGDWLRRHRVVLSLLAGAGAAVVIGGTAWPVAGAGGAVGCWLFIARAEPGSVRERREEVRRALPHVVALFGAALRGGAAPGAALALVADALPGPPTEAARHVAGRLDLGADPGEAWRWLATEPGLASWGRTMARAHETGAPVVDAVERLALELAEEARAAVEDQARTVGVRAAVPLGLCLLPSFLLIGIVPLVAGLLGSLW